MADSGERTRRDGFGVPAWGSCPAVVKMGEGLPKTGNIDELIERLVEADTR